MKSGRDGAFYEDIASRAGSMAVSWLSPVVSWLGNWMSSDSTQAIHRRSAASQIAASLVTEVVQQGRMLEELQEQRRQRELADSGAADYRYLQKAYLGRFKHIQACLSMLRHD